MKSLVGSGHQPEFMPALSLFDRMARSDLFIVATGPSRVSKSWHWFNRNRVIDRSGGEQWLTVPLKKSSSGQQKLMLEAEIAPKPRWREKHLGLLQHCYARTEGWKRYRGEIEELYGQAEGLAWRFNLATMMWLKKRLRLTTPVMVWDDEYPTDMSQTGSDWVLSMFVQIEATHYYSGPSGRDYLDEAKFRKHGISIVYQDYEPPVYPQVAAGPYRPWLSALDLVLNCPDEAWRYIDRRKPYGQETGCASRRIDR